jgi:calcium-dependent protein kinase
LIPAAIPKTPRNRKSSPKYLLKLQNEVDCMRQLGASLNAVFLQDVFEDDSHVYMVMELCEGGLLMERLQVTKLTEARVSRIIKAVLQFLAQCHSKGIVYRDIKPDNFLFLSKSEDSPLKATDFGLAVRWTPDDPPLTSRSGTPAYMAPEVIKQCYDYRCDVWSAGVLMYQLLTGRWPCE